jgi:hypothetical protein
MNVYVQWFDQGSKTWRFTSAASYVERAGCTLVLILRALCLDPISLVHRQRSQDF